MTRTAVLSLVVYAALSLLCALVAVGQEPPRFVERTPFPKTPAAHTMQRAGNANTVAPWAVPGVTRFAGGGYVGGGSLRGNAVLAKGAYTAPGPVADGTFGWDFIGFGRRPGRVFLAPSPDPAAARPVARNYRTDGPHVLDVFSLRLFRRAVLEKKDAIEDRK